MRRRACRGGRSAGTEPASGRLLSPRTRRGPPSRPMTSATVPAPKGVPHDFEVVAVSRARGRGEPVAGSPARAACGPATPSRRSSCRPLRLIPPRGHSPVLADPSGLGFGSPARRVIGSAPGGQTSRWRSLFGVGGLKHHSHGPPPQRHPARTAMIAAARRIGCHSGAPTVGGCLNLAVQPASNMAAGVGCYISSPQASTAVTRSRSGPVRSWSSIKKSRSSRRR